MTFIHGDGQGLDELIANLRARLDATGRSLVLRAPAIGERVLIDRVQPPDNWDVETDGHFVRAAEEAPAERGRHAHAQQIGYALPQRLQRVLEILRLLRFDAAKLSCDRAHQRFQSCELLGGNCDDLEVSSSFDLADDLRERVSRAVESDRRETEGTPWPN